MADAAGLVAQADRLVTQGRYAEAETILRALLDEVPLDIFLLDRLGTVLEKQGRPDDALVVYGDSIAAHPAEHYAFTRRALILLRRHFGPPVPARALSDDAPRFTLRDFGWGRFANQALQYALLRLQASEQGLPAAVPDWLGRDLFDLDDPFSKDVAASKVWLYQDLRALETLTLAPQRDFFRSLFRPGRKLAPLLETAMAKLRGRGRTLVALHLRHGDYGYGSFWIAPSDWSLEWLGALWPSLDAPVLYVATDNPAAVEEFRRYRPLSAADFGVAAPGAEFYPDFHVLCEADAVAISNSTFSFMATMLNSRAARFVRPDLDAQALVPYEPWNARLLL
jgi:hypothetical protein